MPSTPRGRNAATFLAVALAIVLAFAWLRSSDGAAPQVPAGLSVETLPTVTPDEPPAPAEEARTTKGIERERAGGARTPTRKAKPRRAERAAKRRRADRAGGGEDARTRRGTAGEAGGQDPPATAPAPAAGSGTGGGAPSSRAVGPPEFALE